jgi:Tetratricopeptide repeat
MFGVVSREVSHLFFEQVLNNLGCLFYLRGSLDTAVTYFEESLDLQSRIAEQSLYVGSRFSCHNGSLNATITKGNLGLLALATGDPSMSITAFEAALRVSHTFCRASLLGIDLSLRLIPLFI